MIKRSLFLPALLIMGLCLSAQTSSDAESSVYRLMDSGFLKTYKDYRAEVEQYAALFKAKQSQYKPEDAVVLRTSYTRTAGAFEDFIYSVRNDMLDKKMRRIIAKDSEGYVRQKLEKLNLVYGEYVTGKFKPAYTAICQPDSAALATTQRAGTPADIPLALIAPIAQATMQVIDFLDKKGDRDLDQLKLVLENEWVKPNRFTPWEQI
jgi:hypothetical protein